MDVAVDIRKDSPTFGKHVAVELSAENQRQLFIPRDFLHGFSVLSEEAIFAYKCDNLYCKEAEFGIRYDDEEIGIDWKVPADKVITSEKDRLANKLEDIRNANKILVTGANGQLGTELQKLLSDAIFTDVDVLDITDLEMVKKFVKDNNIGTIVNCAAYTAVDKAEDDEERAQKINEVGPYNLAMSGAKIIHVSTDYVFDGKGYKPYLEDDETNPVSVYGKTKRAGELAVINNAKIGVVIRTAWLYSAHGGNFVKTMRKLGSERESLNVVADQIGTPTFAGDLAEAIVKIIPQLSEENRGIYHFTNEGVCSWYDFAVEIMDKSMLKCKVNPIPSSQYPTRAVRPFYSVLSKLKIKEVSGVEIKHWKDGLVRCLKQF